MDDNSTVDELKRWLVAYTRQLRMEYGQAMVELEVDLDTIVEVQELVAQKMVEWLKDW